MSHIFSEETSGSSKKSLTHALANAIQSALKGYDGGDVGLKLTVIIEGYTVENGEFKVNVKVLILDPKQELEEKYHETKKELNERMEANQELAEQMHSAIYAMPIATQSAGVNHIEDRMDARADHSNQFEFDTNNDDITVVAPTEFHQHLNAEAKPQTAMAPSIDAPSLDLGGTTPTPKGEDAA